VANDGNVTAKIANNTVQRAVTNIAMYATGGSGQIVNAEISNNQVINPSEIDLTSPTGPPGDRTNNNLGIIAFTDNDSTMNTSIKNNIVNDALGVGIYLETVDNSNHCITLSNNVVTGNYLAGSYLIDEEGAADLSIQENGDNLTIDENRVLFRSVVPENRPYIRYDGWTPSSVCGGS
jgi:hypothetical protein